MKIVSFIGEPPRICRILVHLDFWQERIPKGLLPPEAQTDILEVVVREAFDDGWGDFDTTDNTLH
jgi:hypothetical protein